MLAEFLEKMSHSFHDELQKIAAAGKSGGMGAFVPGMVVGGLGAIAAQRKLRDMQLGAEMRRQQVAQARGY